MEHLDLLGIHKLPLDVTSEESRATLATYGLPDTA